MKVDAANGTWYFNARFVLFLLSGVCNLFVRKDFHTLILFVEEKLIRDVLTEQQFSNCLLFYVLHATKWESTLNHKYHKQMNLN